MENSSRMSSSFTPLSASYFMCFLTKWGSAISERHVVQTQRNRIRVLTGSLARISTRMSSWSVRTAAQPSGIEERRKERERCLLFLIIHSNLSAGFEIGFDWGLRLALFVILGVVELESQRS